MSVVSLAEHNSARALVHYLAQRGASAAVCGRSPAGYHVTLAAIEGIGAKRLAAGVTGRSVQPLVWMECIAQLFARCDATRGRHLSAALLKAMRDNLSEKLAKAPHRFGALVTAYRNRSNRFDTSRRQRARVVADIRRVLPTLTGAARNHGATALAVLQAESGQYRGQCVTVPLLDKLFGRNDEEALHLLRRRLPDAWLRREAARRIIRLAIRISPYRELLRRSLQVENAVLRDGYFAVPFSQYPLMSARIEEQAFGSAPFQLVQHVLSQSVLVRRRPRESTVPLRKVLWFEVKGLKHPITLCKLKRTLDPTPCVLPRSIRSGHARVFVDKKGALTFSNWSARAAARTFRSPASVFRIPIRVAGKVVAVVARPVRFVLPEAMWFNGASPGHHGPALFVSVHDGPRLLYEVRGAGRSYVAVAERSAVPRFRLVSRGGCGRHGVRRNDGARGASGANGTDASCSSSSGTDGSDGQDGGNGEDGEPGGPGGDGGRITVRVHCQGLRCRALLQHLRGAILSKGGPGGEGGKGGRGGEGGAGGRGGSGTSCTDSKGNTTHLSGGTDGRRGNRGSDGSSGPTGRHGRPGLVRFVVEGGK